MVSAILILQRPEKPDNTLWVALSAAGAGLIVILTVASGYIAHILSVTFAV